MAKKKRKKGAKGREALPGGRLTRYMIDIWQALNHAVNVTAVVEETEAYRDHGFASVDEFLEKAVGIEHTLMEAVRDQVRARLVTRPDGVRVLKLGNWDGCPIPGEGHTCDDDDE